MKYKNYQKIFFKLQNNYICNYEFINIKCNLELIRKRIHLSLYVYINKFLINLQKFFK